MKRLLFHPLFQEERGKVCWEFKVSPITWPPIFFPLECQHENTTFFDRRYSILAKSLTKFWERGIMSYEKYRMIWFRMLPQKFEKYPQRVEREFSIRIKNIRELYRAMREWCYIFCCFSRTACRWTHDRVRKDLLFIEKLSYRLHILNSLISERTIKISSWKIDSLDSLPMTDEENISFHRTTVGRFLPELTLSFQMIWAPQEFDPQMIYRSLMSQSDGLL